eukprot:scpid104035/ scgid30440/ 
MVDMLSVTYEGPKLSYVTPLFFSSLRCVIDIQLVCTCTYRFQAIDLQGSVLKVNIICESQSELNSLRNIESRPSVILASRSLLGSLKVYGEKTIALWVPLLH